MRATRLWSIIIAAASIAVAFTGCNNDQPQQVQQYAPQQQQEPAGVSQQYQPQVVQQAPEDHTIRDGLIGAGVGYMLGRHTAGGGGTPSYSGGSPGYSHPPVVHNTTVVKKVYVQQNVKQFNRPPVNTSPRSYRPSISSKRR